MDLFQPSLELHFSNCPIPELIKTVFLPSPNFSKIIGQRSLGILPTNTVSFKWTPCSKALALFFVKAKIHLNSNNTHSPILEGYSLSPAASLAARLWKRDYAWIHDIFGTDRDGSPLLRQLLYGINIRQKTKAPIQLFLRSNTLNSERLAIYIGTNYISDNPIALMHLSERLNNSWTPGVSRKTVSTGFGEREMLESVDF